MMKEVFLVMHSYEGVRGDDRDKTIGIYSSQSLAEEAVSRLIGLDGFSKYPEGFSINSLSINKDQWTSGFGAAGIDWPMEE